MLLLGDSQRFPRVVEYDHDSDRNGRYDLRSGLMTDVGEWLGLGDGGEGPGSAQMG